ncbi:hypothetical protein [Modestobacter sp. URMC 112]
MTGPSAAGPSGAGPDRALREGLRRLADHAPPPRGPDTADRAVAHDRAQRRRWAAWTAAVLAVGAVLAAVPAAVSGLPADPADVAADGAPADRSLYDVPTRGSLAGDEEFLAGLRTLEWGGPSGPPDAGASELRLRPPEDTRRVLFAGDVPGGSRWALVMGRVEDQLVHAWFTGPAGAAAQELSLTGDPVRTDDGRPITLMDARSATGPLVVVARPGLGAEYSPSLDRDASGRLRRAYVELPVVDGVPLGEVAAPVADGSGRVRLLRDGRDGTAEALVVLTTLEDVSAPRQIGPGDPRFWVRLRDCLAPLGFEVTLDPGGNGLSVSGGPALAPDVGPLSSAEQAENDAARDRCLAQVGGR